MTRRKSGSAHGPFLYAPTDRVRARRLRRQRALFIPRLLDHAARSNFLRGEEQDRAYEIILRWAELESSGQLEQSKETAIRAQFLNQVFGAQGSGVQVFGVWGGFLTRHV